MGQEMEQMHQMLQSVQQSMEAQELRIKEYDAETKRLSALSDKMTPEDVQAVVIQTLRDVMEAGNPAAPSMPEEPPMMTPEPEPQMMDPSMLIPEAEAMPPQPM